MPSQVSPSLLQAQRPLQLAAPRRGWADRGRRSMVCSARWKARNYPRRAHGLVWEDRRIEKRYAVEFDVELPGGQTAKVRRLSAVLWLTMGSIVVLCALAAPHAPLRACLQRAPGSAVSQGDDEQPSTFGKEAEAEAAAHDALGAAWRVAQVRAGTEEAEDPPPPFRSSVLLAEGVTVLEIRGRGEDAQSHPSTTQHAQLRQWYECAPAARRGGPSPADSA